MTTLPRSVRAEIEGELNALIDNVLSKYSSGGKGRHFDPMAKSGKKQKPFMFGLFPDVVRPSEIERSLTSSMGNYLEEIAKHVAKGRGWNAETAYVVRGQIAPAVDEHIRRLVRKGRAREKPQTAPDVLAEMRAIQNINQGPKVAGEVEIDLYANDGTTEYYFDMKTPSPNSDQPRDMKDRLMRARALRLPRAVSAFAVFYYNPNGTKGSFTQGQSYLDYAGGEVLVGESFWNFIAGRDIYTDLVGVFQSVGRRRSAELKGLLS
jgi:Type II restriction endonuclease, TdeIII